MQALRFMEAEVVGSGSFGDTWRHGDTAIKIICDGSYPPERLKREVDGLSRVSSEHVVRLLDTRSVTICGHQRPALVFEYIAGDDIARRPRELGDGSCSRSRSARQHPSRSRAPRPAPRWLRSGRRSHPPPCRYRRRSPVRISPDAADGNPGCTGSPRLRAGPRCP